MPRQTDRRRNGTAVRLLPCCFQHRLPPPRITASCPAA
nr:MAG TPA: hypothetical protein [Caudoviricetes sp.]